MTVSKLTKKPRPTNLDIQEQVAEVHDCLNNLGQQVDAQGQQLSTHCQQLVAIADAMGVRLPTEEELARGGEVKRIGKKLGGISPWQAAGGAAAVITCSMAVYRVIEPALVAGALALHHALMGH